MARDWLGQFGSGLDDRKLGAALAGAGGFRRFPLEVDPRGRVSLDRWLYWPWLPLGVPPGLDAIDSLRHWRDVVSRTKRNETPTRYGLAVSVPWRPLDASPTMLGELVELLGAGEDVASVHVATSSLQPSAPWLWPLHVAVLDDVASRDLRESLDALHFREFARSVRAATATEPIELLALPHDLAYALREVLAAPRLTRVQTVLVLGGLGSPPDAFTMAETLRSETRADAVAIADVPPDRRVAFLDAVLRELSHDIDVDVAVTAACRELRLRAPLLLGSVDAFARAHAAVWSREIADRLTQSPAAILHPVSFVDTTGGARAAGQNLASVLKSFRWDRERNEATAMAHLGAAARDAAREETSRERRLQAELFGDNHEAVKHAPLQPGEYQLEVWVGAPMKDAMQAPIAFPSESLPFSPTGFELTVVVTSHNTGIPNASRQLLLPVVGASERLNFSMHISRDQRRSDVRIAILHEGRLLQTVLLSATVGSGERRDLSLSLEGVIRRDLDGVSGRRPFDASLLFNDLGDEPSVTAYAGQNVSLCDSKRIDAVLATITQILEDATNRPKLHGTPDKKKSTELLASLARQGHLLREALLEMPNVQASLSQASRIQVVTKRPEEPIPLEICYDAPPPANGAGMCKEWKRALAGGACQTRCPPNKSEVVCPVAFWGTKIVIERHQYSKEAAREVGSNDFAIHQREPTGGKRISLVGTSVCGAAKVARSADPAAVDSAFHAAAAAVGSMAGVANEVKTWADWQVAVSGGTARLLVLLAHTDVRGTDRALVIHEDELALLTEIGAGYVVGTGNAPPVVLLLGCSTALPDGLAQFTTRFRRAGAAVVVGTLCRVLGRHSAPIARVLIEKLALASRKPDPTPFGELLRDIRREMLAEGYPIVFAITAFGDADWVV